MGQSVEFSGYPDIFAAGRCQQLLLAVPAIGFPGMLTEAQLSRLQQIVPSVTQLDETLRGRIRAESSVVTASAHSVMSHEGDSCDHLTVVFSGILRLTKISGSGRRLLLHELRAGQLCGLSLKCLTSHGPFPAECQAQSDVVVARIPKEIFYAWLACNGDFRSQVFEALGYEVEVLTRLLEEIAFQRVNQRLAALLLRAHNGNQDEPLAMTHQALADDLGSSREIVSRTLEVFESRGLVQLGRRKIQLLDCDGLSSLALDLS